MAAGDVISIVVLGEGYEVRVPHETISHNSLLLLENFPSYPEIQKNRMAKPKIEPYS